MYMFYQVQVQNKHRVKDKVLKIKDKHFHLKTCKIQVKIHKSQYLKNAVYFVNLKGK